MFSNIIAANILDLHSFGQNDNSKPRQLKVILRSSFEVFKVLRLQAKLEPSSMCTRIVL